MTPELKREIWAKAGRVAATMPTPTPEQAARLRAWLNPPDLAERMARQAPQSARERFDAVAESKAMGVRNKGHHGDLTTDNSDE